MYGTNDTSRKRRASSLAPARVDTRVSSRQRARDYFSSPPSVATPHHHSTPSHYRRRSIDVNHPKRRRLQALPVPHGTTVDPLPAATHDLPSQALQTVEQRRAAETMQLHHQRLASDARASSQQHRSTQQPILRSPRRHPRPARRITRTTQQHHGGFASLTAVLYPESVDDTSSESNTPPSPLPPIPLFTGPIISIL
jgi:hypothetical protein